MGYAGGTSSAAVYHNLDGHSETIQVDFDPETMSYERLLEVFFASHDPTRPSPSRQYASVIFWSDGEQRLAAEEMKRSAEERLGTRVFTEIRPLKVFVRAEDYHQKYYLRNDRILSEALMSIYPDATDFTDSTAVARVNGYLGGDGTPEDLSRDLPELGLPEEAQRRLRLVLDRMYR